MSNLLSSGMKADNITKQEVFLLFSTVNDQFLGLGCLLAVIAGHASAIQINTTEQGEATTCCQIPGDGVEAAIVSSRLGVCPQKTPREVEDIDGELTVGSRTVVAQEELGVGASGIDAGRQFQD